MDFPQFKTQFSISLDPQQEAAIQAVHGPVLLLAVPGSGKTTVLVTRLGYMRYVCGIDPGQILTMTYTVAAARDMRTRFASLFGEKEAISLEFRTINGVCSKIIRYYEQVYCRTAFCLLEDNAEKNMLIGELYRMQSGEYATESAIKALQTAITYAKNQMLQEDELRQIEVEGIDFLSFYRSYCKQLREQKLMDYDDQMVYALQILRQYPNILRDLQTRYQYICVDEAQDTSKIQHAIIRLLAGQRGNLFLVGDEDQSIYGFRAAYPQALTQFDQIYSNATVLYLEQNYRSTPQIVTVANAFIQKNKNRRPKHMRAIQADGPKIQSVSVYDRQAQYQYLCKQAEHCTVETAVLFRDNDSALPLIDRMDRLGIPYRCRQMEGLFFTNRVVRDITDMIRFSQDPNDSELFLRIYYKLGAGISKSLAEEAATFAERGELPILSYIASSPAASPWTKKQCRALQTHMTNLLQEPADRAVYRIVHFMGYGSYLEERGYDLGKADILEALGSQEPTPDRLLIRLEELKKVVQSGSSDPMCPFILSTIHSSKGLEYERVILMDVVDGLLPKNLPGINASVEELNDYEEERRLFYVGMTRAKRELTLITFRKAGLTSTFSQEIFPPTPNQNLRPKSNSLSMSPIDPEEDHSISELRQNLVSGVRLLHQTFGPGTLISLKGDIAVIALDCGETKKIAISTAMRAKQLQLE